MEVKLAIEEIQIPRQNKNIKLLLIISLLFLMQITFFFYFPS